MPDPSATHPDKPWYSHLTIDLLARVLARTIFHPFIACLLPLCVRAVGADYDHPRFIATCIFASAITLLALLGALNKRLAYGLPRELDWDAEVVLITGGASGLGKLIAEMYGMRGASVAVLDVKQPEKESEGLSGVRFYHCDVGDARAVERAKQQIEEDLGAPTILVNNAGIVNREPLLSLSPAQVQRNFSINLHSHFYTLRAFLPAMLRSNTGGTVVTVASVLGKLGASHLSDYTAAKAGLIAMHASLRAELASPTAPQGAHRIRTILVTPGQLSTALFAGTDTPSPFFGPVVEPVDLAREIVRMLDAGESGEISLPLYARWVEWLQVLPAGVQKVARGLAGVDGAMEGFSPRAGLEEAATAEEKAAVSGVRK